jgi:hypothetical protein
MKWSTYSSTEWERTGELLPSIAGVARALTGVEASERREVEAPFERSGRKFLSIVMYVAVGAVQYGISIGRSIASQANRLWFISCHLGKRRKVAPSPLLSLQYEHYSTHA